MYPTIAGVLPTAGYNFENSQYIRELELEEDPRLPDAMIVSQAACHGLHPVVLERCWFGLMLLCGQVGLALGYGW
jgi:hypothetical protein